MSGLQDYFEDGYLRRWMLDPPSKTHLDEAVSFLSLGGAATAARVLDLGCGHGRYSVGLARAGARVVGVDGSNALLKRAAAQTAGLPYQISWVRADMRAIPLTSAFDLVLAVDAFGYFDAENDGIAVLREVRRVLRDGGRLIMRNPNATLIRRDFKPSDEEQRGDVHTTIRRTLGPQGRTMVERLAIDNGTGTREFERRARIYAAAELETALCDAGFTVVEHFATPSGERFENGSSPRMVTLASKAGSRL